MADTAIDRTRQNLESELDQLRERRRSLAAELTGREPTGDRADQADLLEQAEDVALLDDRIADLTQRLAGGSDELSEGRLAPGTEVTVRFADGEVSTLRAVAVPEEVAEDDEFGALTLDSPLGLALPGSEPGDQVTYLTPSGEAQVEVVALQVPGDEP